MRLVLGVLALMCDRVAVTWGPTEGASIAKSAVAGNVAI